MEALTFRWPWKLSPSPSTGVPGNCLHKEIGSESPDPLEALNGLAR